MTKTQPASSRMSEWWNAIQASPAPPGWRSEPALAACVTVADAAEKAREPRADAVLSFLLRQLQAGDTLAGAVVLYSLFGALRHLAASGRGRSAPQSQDLWDDYLGQAWIVMASYPLERRPSAIAANLMWDTFKALGAPQRARSRRAETPWEPSLIEVFADAAPAAEPMPTAAELITRALRLGFIDELSARVLHSVYVEGMPGRVAAVRHATTPTAIRWRCSSSLRRLASHCDELLEAS